MQFYHLLKGNVFEAACDLCQYWSYSTSVHFHFKVALFVRIKQNPGSSEGWRANIWFCLFREIFKKGFYNMEMTTYVSFYKDSEVDVFDPVRWPMRLCPFETVKRENSDKYFLAKHPNPFFIYFLFLNTNLISLSICKAYNYFQTVIVYSLQDLYVCMHTQFHIPDVFIILKTDHRRRDF